jgi:NADPH2:quinone reductase
MEAALNRNATEYSRYGSETLKQVYLYGTLDNGPTEFVRNFGFSWGMGGWLLFPFLKKAGPEVAARLRQRVVDELTTTFASHYSHEVTLAQALTEAAIRRYYARATGDKYLIVPSRG